MLRDGPSKQIIIEVNNVEVGAHYEHRGDDPLETVRREVQNDEVDQGL